MPLLDPLGAVATAIKNAGIVPDVIPGKTPFIPEALLLTRWPTGKEAMLGNTLTTIDTADEPSVSFTPMQSFAAATDVGYTLVMTDPDAPSRSDPKMGQWRHWLVTGLKAPALSALDTGDLSARVTRPATTPYYPPAPPRGTGPHRYVFLLYQEPSVDFMIPTHADEYKNRPKDRAKWNAAHFAERYKYEHHELERGDIAHLLSQIHTSHTINSQSILMVAPRQPISSSADYAAQLEILHEIERLGGSAGYDAKPDAFSDFVPVSDPTVWAKAINELEENATEPDARALKAKLQAELDLQHSVRVALLQLCLVMTLISYIIKGIESLGGSVGFQKFMVNPRTVSSQSGDQGTAASCATQAAADEWPHCYATGFIQRALITRLDFFANQHSGSGHAWGPALGIGNLQGVLFYSSFDADSFSFENASAGAGALMKLNGVTTSFFVGALIGVSQGFSFEGSWSW
ncbi:phosphatidylethanolamine-binding protein [Butyriboletus roseoflavus]|nr:phosphatidylethanolamine-binding protein [Butyriboletus roseoflavus]